MPVLRIATASLTSWSTIASVLFMAWVNKTFEAGIAAIFSLSESEIEASDHGEKDLWIGSSAGAVLVSAVLPRPNSTSSPQLFSWRPKNH